ncbi:NAD(+) diphosphatase [Martelella endophytica]|uniref:NAD(+) diphosphatase n=1 Tax=Martelella endophytica TaxID=1486262 RepID=A0A0D5LJX6_MAREN|nr:NAD(+) diphosphatase [Martelella endophytica]AJY44436.1 DNA mismatch repair protein MutT [Martelella endophytica]
MTSIFDRIGPHDDPSAMTAFAGCRIIRDSEHREDDALSKAAAEPEARFFVFADGVALVKHERQVLDPYFARYEVQALQPDRESAVLLGHTPAGAPLIAIDSALDTKALPGHLKTLSARAAYSEGLLEGEALGAFALAVSVNAWTRNHRFCGRCGGKSDGTAGGFRRQCTVCGHMMFPRTDPVVIMLIVDEARDRVLLGRSPHFPAGRYSCLAGFVEPGETVEDAVRRETLEESRIRVGAVRYHASQPWPMPHSLMLACYGKAESFDVSYDDDELEDCRWFSRDELAAITEHRHPDGINGPPEGAIAFRLMRDFLDWR